MNQVFELEGICPTLPESGDCWIAPGTFVIGNVVLGEGTSVWFGTTIRGDNETVITGRQNRRQVQLEGRRSLTLWWCTPMSPV